MSTTAAGAQKRNARKRDAAAHGYSNTGPSDPSDGDALEELFRWGAKVASERNMTVEKLDAVLKRVRERLRE